MMLSTILLELTMTSFIVALWVFFFFVFNDIILKGYFKKKLQKRFKVEE